MWEEWKAGLWLSILSILCHFHGLFFETPVKAKLAAAPLSETFDGYGAKNRFIVGCQAAPSYQPTSMYSSCEA